MSAKKDEPGNARRPGQEQVEPPASHLPPDLQQANVSNARKVEEDIAPAAEPIQQYREGRRRKKPSTPKH